MLSGADPPYAQSGALESTGPEARGWVVEQGLTGLFGHLVLAGAVPR